MGEQQQVTGERELLRRARANDEEALGTLYDEYAPLIYRYLYRRVQDAQIAEDLTSEVFVRMLQAIQSANVWRTSFRAWLYRIAHNLAVDHYRKQPPAPALSLDEGLVADQGDADSVLAERLSHQRLQAAIRLLTPGQQQVLALRFGEHLTTRQVAEIMGKNTGAVEALQHRALAALRRMLQKG